MGGGQKLNRLRRKIGAVLIEFAFAIPVFLVLIYYIHDLPKQKLMQRKMQLVANEIAAILQNIGSQRAIVRSDFSKAMSLAYLSVYPGITMYSTRDDTYFPLGYFPHVWVYYIVGTGENKATVKWYCTTWPTNTPAAYRRQASTSGQHPESTVRFTSGSASSIHPNLKIKSGEVKIIVECTLWYDHRNRFFSGSNISCGKVPVRKAFNFLLLSPKANDSTAKVNFFTGISMFTPSTSMMLTDRPPSE